MIILQCGGEAPCVRPAIMKTAILAGLVGQLMCGRASCTSCPDHCKFNYWQIQEDEDGMEYLRLYANKHKNTSR